MSEAWAGDDRRNNDFNVKSAILSEISKTDDTAMKTVLLLMLGVFEANEKGIGRIERKIDAVLRDEAQLKRLVLNGHDDTHHDDHDWIADRRNENCSEACKWATKKMQDEKDAEKDKKSLWRKFLEGGASHAGSVLAGGFLLWLALQFKG